MVTAVRLSVREKKSGGRVGAGLRSGHFKIPHPI